MFLIGELYDNKLVKELKELRNQYFIRPGYTRMQRLESALIVDTIDDRLKDLGVYFNISN